MKKVLDVALNKLLPVVVGDRDVGAAGHKVHRHVFAVQSVRGWMGRMMKRQCLNALLSGEGTDRRVI